MKYRKDLERQEGCSGVAHERLTEPRVTVESKMGIENSITDFD